MYTGNTRTVTTTESSSLHHAAPTTPSPEISAYEEVIRRAHQLVSPDLYVIERLVRSGITPEYAAIFGAQMQPKIAALLFLARQKLLDIHQSEKSTREIDEARRDLAGYVQTIFHLHAVEGLGIFFDLAARYGGETPSGLWANVRSRSLHLMTRRPENAETVCRFLLTRPAAVTRLRELAASTNPDIAEPAGKMLTVFAKFCQSDLSRQAPPPPPLFVCLYEEYERELPADAAIGMSAWLTAKDRIEQAVIAGDIPALMEWIAEGSPMALRETLRFAESVMSVPQYVDLLERALYLEGISARRRTVLVHEAGALNRKANRPDGDPTLNRILAKVAMTEQKDMLEVARTAVQELGSVKAFKNLMAVMEHAPNLTVAEAALETLKQQRQMPLIREVVEKRPALGPAFRQATQYVQSLRTLMETISSCHTDETMLVYLSQLKNERAIPELQELAKRRNRVGELALQTLMEIDPSLAIRYY